MMMHSHDCHCSFNFSELIPFGVVDDIAASPSLVSTWLSGDAASLSCNRSQLLRHVLDLADKVSVKVTSCSVASN